MKKLAVVILAAGDSRRFGVAKQLAIIDGRPMLQVVIDHCCSIPGTDLYVALGARTREILAKLDLKETELIEIKDWSLGIGSTISNSVTQLGSGYDAILFIAGDQPAVTREHLKPLIACWYASPNLVCCASYESTRGIPAIFPARLFPELVALHGDQGAKQLIQAEYESLRVFEMPEAAIDIDRPEDVAKIGDSPKD